jgi:hypothetical protein
LLCQPRQETEQVVGQRRRANDSVLEGREGEGKA